ncbi:MAG: lipid-A-disaccharide synthase [Opitutales bacterium]|nr:lipid-A-disaccharide synthase [Opitutales bacterium]
MQKRKILEFNPLPAGQSVDLLVIAGEHSGDEHAARVVQRLLRSQPDLNVAAIGGRHLADAGAFLVHNPIDSAVVGFVEVLKHLSEIKAFFSMAFEWIKTYRPKAVCFVDYPGFNLRLAKKLFDAGIAHKAGGNVKLLFYISPQIWAWKSHRRFAMARHLDALGVIFPFEIESYRDTNLPVSFVGHPFVHKDYRLPLVYDPEAPLLLLPGSRATPIKRIMPAMIETFRRLKTDNPTLRATVVYPSEPARMILQQMVDQSDCTGDMTFVSNAEPEVRARGVIMSSGTISLVCALAAIPGILVYRTNPITYGMAKILVSIRIVGIANILLGEFIHPEFLQGRMQPARMAAALDRQLHDNGTLERTRALSTKLRSILSHSDSVSPESWIAAHLIESPP